MSVRAKPTVSWARRTPLADSLAHGSKSWQGCLSNSRTTSLILTLMDICATSLHTSDDLSKGRHEG